MREVTGPPWKQLGHDGVKASAAAANGTLVVGGVTSQALGDAHGHVVIVVKGPLAHGKYPTDYWGKSEPCNSSDGGLGTTLNFSFNTNDRDGVTCACFGNPTTAP